MYYFTLDMVLHCFKKSWGCWKHYSKGVHSQLECPLNLIVKPMHLVESKWDVTVLNRLIIQMFKAIILVGHIFKVSKLNSGCSSFSHDQFSTLIDWYLKHRPWFA